MNDDIFYIGLCGNAGAGKDTVAEFIEKNSIMKVVSISMADPLKRTVSELYGVPLNYFYDRELKEENIPGMDVTPRDILQTFGTDIMRNFDPDHWVKRFNKEINKHKRSIETINKPIDVIIIPDVRFPNEIKMIRNREGIIICVRRDIDSVGEMNKEHASETSIDYQNDFLFDYVIYNNKNKRRLELDTNGVLNLIGLR